MLQLILSCRASFSASRFLCRSSVCSLSSLCPSTSTSSLLSTPNSIHHVIPHRHVGITLSLSNSKEIGGVFKRWNDKAFDKYYSKFQEKFPNATLKELKIAHQLLRLISLFAFFSSIWFIYYSLKPFLLRGLNRDEIDSSTINYREFVQTCLLTGEVISITFSESSRTAMALLKEDMQINGQTVQRVKFKYPGSLKELESGIRKAESLVGEKSGYKVKIEALPEFNASRIFGLVLGSLAFAMFFYSLRYARITRRILVLTQKK